MTGKVCTGNVSLLAAPILWLALSGGAAAADTRPPSSNGSAQQALAECLQETATRFAAECKAAGCPPERLYRIIGLAQRTYCGYAGTQGQAAHAVPPEPLLKCLRQTADDTTLACEKAGCPTNSVFFIIGAAQKSRCGFTAYEPMELPPANPPHTNLANCVTSPDSNGGWKTECSGPN